MEEKNRFYHTDRRSTSVLCITVAHLATAYKAKKEQHCTYKVGEMVYADSWDDNRWNECSHGIHFFVDRQSAVDY